jgi:preprotein translocase subunit SecE
VAESKRRGDDAVDEHLVGRVFDDGIDDDVLDSSGRRGNGRSRRSETVREDRLNRAVQRRADQLGRDVVKSGRAPRVDQLDPFGRLGRFIREVVAELRKVIWPTRSELLTYTSVVIVFIAAMMTIVGLLDLGFAHAILVVFGGK